MLPASHETNKYKSTHYQMLLHFLLWLKMQISLRWKVARHLLDEQQEQHFHDLMLALLPF